MTHCGVFRHLGHLARSAKSTLAMFWITTEEASVFDEVLGLPAHPMIVHAAVVFVPLLVVAAVVYALVPSVRRWITWAVLGLAVVAPLAAWFATLSGNALRNRYQRQGIAPEFMVKIDEHRDFGDKTLWASVGLAVLVVILFAVGRAWTASGTPKKVVNIVLTVGVLGFAVVSAYYVFKTGDSGARVVWGNV